MPDSSASYRLMTRTCKLRIPLEEARMGGSTGDNVVWKTCSSDNITSERACTAYDLKSSGSRMAAVGYLPIEQGASKIAC